MAPAALDDEHPPLLSLRGGPGREDLRGGRGRRAGLAAHGGGLRSKQGDVEEDSGPAEEEVRKINNEVKSIEDLKYPNCSTVTEIQMLNPDYY